MKIKLNIANLVIRWKKSKLISLSVCLSGMYKVGSNKVVQFWIERYLKFNLLITRTNTSRFPLDFVTEEIEFNNFFQLSLFQTAQNTKAMTFENSLKWYSRLEIVWTLLIYQFFSKIRDQGDFLNSKKCVEIRF